jgi:hypothetical protein
VAAAVEAMQQRSDAARTRAMHAEIERMSQKLKAFEALAPDPKTPMGAVRAMFEAGTKGDLQAVRHRLICNQNDPDKSLDLLARWIVASTSLQAQIVAKFGHDTVFKDAALNSVNQCELSVAATNWVPAPDGGLQERGSSPMAIVKGSDGEYYLDMSRAMTEVVNARPYLLTLSQKMEQVGQMLKDNPALTLEQLDAAMMQPVTRPTTQKSGT